jgi:hypothetical protein
MLPKALPRETGLLHLVLRCWSLGCGSDRRRERALELLYGVDFIVKNDPFPQVHWLSLVGNRPQDLDCTWDIEWNGGCSSPACDVQRHNESIKFVFTRFRSQGFLECTLMDANEQNNYVFMDLTSKAGPDAHQ